MSQYNLTENQKEFLKWLINEIKQGNLNEEFCVTHTLKEISLSSPKKLEVYNFPSSESPQATLEVLVHEQIITCIKSSQAQYRYVVTQRAYDAVKSNFNEPDTSFTRHITPLADVSNLDNELKKRCLPILSAGSSDSTLWDSAVRTAGVF
jgi:hypothetical protein